MTTSEAKNIMEDGYLVRRDKWENANFYIYALGVKVYDCNNSEYNIWHSNSDANDWKVYSKKNYFWRLLKRIEHIKTFIVLTKDTTCGL